MGLENATPLTVDQLLWVLAALGEAHVADPDQRSGGPAEDDRSELLGALPALVETGTAILVDPKQDPPFTCTDSGRGGSTRVPTATSTVPS
ncbi:hypothetical protein ADL21_20615 [Streptomyces albus subsp. albus]|nr:hypothetical protein ADL21_20615 [Streptomyces albus subsp. albus]